MWSVPDAASTNASNSSSASAGALMRTASASGAAPSFAATLPPSRQNSLGWPVTCRFVYCGALYTFSAVAGAGNFPWASSARTKNAFTPVRFVPTSWYPFWRPSFSSAFNDAPK